MARREELDARLASGPTASRGCWIRSSTRVLLIGLYELTSRPEVPFRVAINEAVGLAKRFGATDGHKFVNAVLDRAARAAAARTSTEAGARESHATVGIRADRALLPQLRARRAPM